MKSYRSNEKIQNNVNKNVSTDYLSPRNDLTLAFAYKNKKQEFIQLYIFVFITRRCMYVFFILI